MNITILLFNNEVYGLTKGQYSPTSPRWTANGLDADGSIDQPFNRWRGDRRRGELCRAAIDTDRKHVAEMLRRAAAHRGASFVEILQNCNIYNDGAFDAVREDEENRIYLRHGEPVRFGVEGARGVRVRDDGSAEIVDANGVGEGALLVHDEHHRSRASRSRSAG